MVSPTWVPPLSPLPPLRGGTPSGVPPQRTGPGRVISYGRSVTPPHTYPGSLHPHHGRRSFGSSSVSTAGGAARLVLAGVLALVLMGAVGTALGRSGVGSSGGPERLPRLRRRGARPHARPPAWTSAPGRRPPRDRPDPLRPAVLHPRRERVGRSQPGGAPPFRSGVLRQRPLTAGTPCARGLLLASSVVRAVVSQSLVQAHTQLPGRVA